MESKQKAKEMLLYEGAERQSSSRRNGTLNERIRFRKFYCQKKKKNYIENKIYGLFKNIYERDQKN